MGVTLIPGPLHRVVAVHDGTTGSVYPLQSLGFSALFCGAAMAAFTAPLGGIPFAIEGAVKAPAGLRLPSATALMCIGARANAASFGAAAALAPLGSYAAERFHLDPNSTAALGMQLGPVAAGMVWATERWTPKGHTAANVSSGVLVLAAVCGVNIWAMARQKHDTSEE
ncbi:hypothetical protein FB451DRAFT_1264722 [Mycena latifolia]|nr:hypothetical protein FB451DRAFT_1264722 [Mycena latifolia]